MSETATTTATPASPQLKLIPLPVDLSLPYSQSPDIIRSNQRDIQYSLTFSEQYKNFLLQVLGNRWLNKNQNLVDLSSKFIYYSLTTLLCKLSIY
jgi:peroxin-10